MVVWKRAGIILIAGWLLGWPAAGWVLEQFVGERIRGEPPELVALSFIITAPIQFAMVLGFRLARQEHGQELFFIPIRFWPYVSFGFGVLYYLVFGVLFGSGEPLGTDTPMSEPSGK